MSLDVRFHVKLRERLQQLRDERAGPLLDGNLPSFDAYRHCTGYLRAIDDVMKVCEKVETEVTGGK